MLSEYKFRLDIAKLCVSAEAAVIQPSWDGFSHARAKNSMFAFLWESSERPKAVAFHKMIWIPNIVVEGATARYSSLK